MPLILPQRTNFSRPLRLLMWPKNSSCLFLIALINDGSYSARLRTSLLLIFSVQEILKILRRNHISSATKRFSIVLLIVQHSQPYRSTDHMYVFIIKILVSNLMFLLFRTVPIFEKASFDMAIRFLISLSHFAVDVTVKPRYLKISTCLMFVPLQVILQTGLVCFFETTIHSVFLAFS